VTLPDHLAALALHPRLGQALAVLREESDEDASARIDRLVDYGVVSPTEMDVLVNIHLQDASTIAQSLAHAAPGPKQPWTALPRVLVAGAAQAFGELKRTISWRSLSLMIHALERHHYPFDDPHVAMILEEAFRRMDMALALPTHLLRVVLACLRSGRRLEGWELAAVLRNAEEVAPQSNVQHICNLLFALGSMGLQAGRDVPHAWLDRMVEHVSACFDDMVAADVSQVLQGLNGLGYDPGPSMMRSLERLTLARRSDMDAPPFLFAVASMVSLGWQPAPETWEVLEDKVQKTGEFFTPSQLGMALTAFHRAGVRPSPDTMAALERGWEMIWSSASREARVQIADALAAMRYIPRRSEVKQTVRGRMLTEAALRTRAAKNERMARSQ